MARTLSSGVPDEDRLRGVAKRARESLPANQLEVLRGRLDEYLTALARGRGDDTPELHV